jgi:hypothetical protein
LTLHCSYRKPRKRQSAEPDRPAGNARMPMRELRML